MKLSQIAALSAAALTSAGCAGSGGIIPINTGGSGITRDNIAAAILTIRQDTQALCGALPYADSLEQLIKVDWAAAAGAAVLTDWVAHQVCGAVAATPKVMAPLANAVGQRSVVVHVVGPKGSTNVPVKLQ